MKPKFLAVTVWLITMRMLSFAQSDSSFLSRAINSLKNYSETNPVEKAYLQLDKPYYAAGDDIWFKAYVVAGSKHLLSGISGILNVELTGSKGIVSQYIKLPLVNGLTWGDFKLSDTLKEGRYRIIAYTNWMRNAGTGFFFDKVINIGNAAPGKIINSHQSALIPKKPVPIDAKSTGNKTDIQFFPESGNLVYGITSKVAFKAIGDNGLGKDIKGTIIDDQNKEITKLSSIHLGMGVFSLLPVLGRTYKAVVDFPDGSQRTIDLPAPLIKGYVMQIDNSNPASLRLQIEASVEMLKENGGAGINLVAQSGGEVYFAAQSKSMSSIFTAEIPKSKFPTGIVQFTLFSSAGEPLNERLVFIKRNDLLNLSVTPAIPTFTTRQKVDVTLNVKNGEGKAAIGNFSVSVVDETKVPAGETAEGSILSSLLLTSEIKGFIEKTNYYFTDTSRHAGEDLDVLMLTQGYHRFQWKQILAGAVVSVYQPENSLEITGRLKTLGGKPVIKGKVSLLSSESGFFTLDTVSDEKGNFSFKNLQFNDTTKFVVQSKTSKDSKHIKVELDNPTAVSVAAGDLPVTDLDVKDSLSTYLVNSKKKRDKEIQYGVGGNSTVLKEVKIIAKKPVITNSANLNGAGNADQVFIFKDNDLNCGTIAECLIGKLTGVIFLYDQDKYCYFPCMYQDSKLVKMTIELDGMKIEAETLATIPAGSVESIEVLRSGGLTSVYGSDGYNGLILVNTKKGGYAVGNNSTPNIITYKGKGYYKAREFYSPQYDNPKTNPELADLRSTIYWNPNVVTDKDGNASFNYFNAGTKGVYRMVIEGIDINGNLASLIYRYKVE